jgi:cysteine desulfurase / selenocysteine lyase
MTRPHCLKTSMWVTTMSTHEGSPVQPENHSDVTEFNPGLGASPDLGVFSPAELARMANAMFQALPDEVQQPAITGAKTVLPPNSALSGNPYAAIPGPTMPPVPGLLSEVNDAKPQTYVATPDRSIAPDVRGPAPSVPPPSPTSTSAVTPSGVPATQKTPAYDPAFAFLADARPLDAPAGAGSQITSSLPAYTPADTSSSYAAPYASSTAAPETFPFVGVESFRSVPSSLETDSSPSQFAGAPQLPAPAIPGDLDGLDAAPVPAFSFIEDARPLFSPQPAIPGPVPADVSSRTAPPASPFVEPRDQYAPQLPGTVTPRPDARGARSNSPLDGVRPLEPASFVPVLAPSEAQPDLGYDLGLSSASFDVETIRRDFPILQERVNGHPLIWFDNGATTQKPQSVIDRISYFYEHENSNVHRAAHELAARATDAYESAREKTRRFLNAGSTREIVFVRGATEAINLVAQSWGRRNIQKDDEIVLTWMEHHANIVPWQILCAEKGARLRIAPVDDCGQILLDEYEKLLNPKTRFVSITQVSNALGTILPVKEMTEAAHRHGARVLVDGAQAVSHMRVDVQLIGCDFYVFSGHKVFAPTGIGVVFGKAAVLENMPPWQGGGNMIQDVTFEKTLYHAPPQRFEAGTGNIADAVGLGAAIDYLDRVGIANVARHEHELLAYATDALQRIPGVRIIGTAKEKASVLSFTMEGFRTEEIGDYLNRKGIAVRGGHHCAQPILRRFGVESTLRATFALYNTFEEVDSFIAALWDLRQGRTPGLV